MLNFMPIVYTLKKHTQKNTLVSTDHTSIPPLAFLGQIGIKYRDLNEPFFGFVEFDDLECLGLSNWHGVKVEYIERKNGMHKNKVEFDTFYKSSFNIKSYCK